MPMLPDGSYDVVVVDAETDEEGTRRIELVVTLGPHVGRVVTLASRRGAPRDDGDDVALLGVAGTLRVRGGVPAFRPETP